MTNRWAWIVVVATLFLATAPATAAGDKHHQKKNLAPLTGENLLASEIGNPGTSTVSGTCNPLDTSTFTFTVTGIATGPYTGTFTETGTVTLGPFGIPGNPLAATSFESTFTIESAAGTVTGTKTLTGFEPTSLGLCGTAVFPTGGADSLHFEGTASYTATITTPTGSGTDSGQSFVDLQDAQVRGRAGFNGFAFVETYTSSAVPADCDDDEDDQGDCDDQSEEEDDDD